METTYNTASNPANTNSDNIQIGKLWKFCLHHWPWFLLSVLVCLIIAMVYLHVTRPTYTRRASIVVMDDGQGLSSPDMMSSLFSNLSVFRFKNFSDAKTNAKKEMLFIQSDEMLEKVVRRLSLNISYEIDSSFHRETLYGSTQPIVVQFLDFPDDQICSLVINLGNSITLETPDASMPIRLGDTTATPYGRIVITPSLAFSNAARSGMRIYVTHNSIGNEILSCRKRLSAFMDKDVPSIVDFTYVDYNPERAENLLDTLFAAYAEEVRINKRRMADEMAQLIDDRIDLLKDELGDVDNDISQYKRDNSMADIADIVRRARNKETETSNQINAIKHQIYLLGYLRAFTLNPDNFGQVLPSNTGINNKEIEYHVRNHNDKQIERNDWAASITETSPLVSDLDIEIANIKKALVELIDNTILAQEAQLRKTNELHDQALGELANTPNKATYLVTIERQKKVKEQIYIYLLQKREENELSQVFSATNSLVVRTPYGPMTPTAPNYNIILLSALIIGLLLPLIYLWLRDVFTTTIRNHKDVAKLATPLLGEIPLDKHGAKRSKRLRSLNSASTGFVVRDDNSNSLGEAFRIVRTNMEFRLSSTKNEAENNSQLPKVIAVTSVDPSCGKTFFAANIAATFAIKGIRTVCVDLDLRQGSLTRYASSNGQGISAYLSGKADNWHDLIVPVEGYEHFDILHVGDTPSYPVELLSSPRLQQLINELRGEYDVVIVDCPPVEVVADTSIITRHADMTVFVVMVGLTECDALPVIDGYYANQKYPGMALLLNGTAAVRSSYRR